jgi:asparagine synthase (glutamine-hydrolysing)
MCGICGFVRYDRAVSEEDEVIVRKMNDVIRHRGPDAEDVLLLDNVAFGFSRLSIIGLSNGMQPIMNEDRSIVLICNGEIFNYIELRQALRSKGHTFRTESDVEVIVHLYEEYGREFLNKLNGQFAFALYDRRSRSLLCARDHMGIIPFYYTRQHNIFVFGSEIKAILEHPLVRREVDVTGLDQVLTFPGLISPQTMFSNILSLENGHYLSVDERGNVTDREYWDLIYPEGETKPGGRSEQYYTDRLEELLENSIRLRLRSDVPIGLYLSGGLDSSIIAMKMHSIRPDIKNQAFSIDFRNAEMSEAPYQELVAKRSNSALNRKVFLSGDISERLQQVIYHCECPLKETYNTASLSLSETTRKKGIKVILSGEGPDELFAGYPGYRFDQLKKRNLLRQPVTREEEGFRERVWGDSSTFYETDFTELSRIKKELYSPQIAGDFKRIDCLNSFVINKSRLVNRDVLNKRSYLDYKLRLVDHLVSDHGDRMALANSVEVRYPFLDKDFVEFSAEIPPELKLKDLHEKYILKKMASRFVPEAITGREKFGFVAPGSPYLLQNNVEYINDILSYDLIKRQGYFNADYVEALKKAYKQNGFVLEHPFEKDLLIIVITFGILLEQFFQRPAREASLFLHDKIRI